ncbi:OSR-1 protein, partial [Aphelenchoides avenae]
MAGVLPSRNAIEEVGIRFLDALIKAGQIEMAKGALKTQMKVLRKVNPDQYKKYKDIPVARLAAEAVFQQTDAAKTQPKTGNRLIDMLNENGIPLGSSLKGIQQAIKTQKEIENSDPGEQIAKAIFEKFQKQILPGLVANLIAGRNPLQLPQRPELRGVPQVDRDQRRAQREQQEENMKQLNAEELRNVPKVQGQQYDLRKVVGPNNDEQEQPEEEASEENEEKENKSNSREADDEEKEEDTEASSKEGTGQAEEDEASAEKDNNDVRRHRHLRLRRCVIPRSRRKRETGRDFQDADHRGVSQESEERREETSIRLGTKAALLLGLHEIEGIEKSGEEDTANEN